MELDVRLAELGRLGEALRRDLPAELPRWSASARNRNPWFTQTEVERALRAVLPWLEPAALTEWTSGYAFRGKEPKTIGLVLAGNIPLVGFHDYLSVLVSGHRAVIRTSTQDDGLLAMIHGKLSDIAPALMTQSSFVERLNGFDAVIATGSNNSSRYFEYYFSRYPHIIRMNRSSVAILTGDEPEGELEALGADVFSYFGLGCRNVSKLFVPQDYPFDNLISSWDSYARVIDHHKYANNYDYQKSILILNRVPFLESPFVILKEDEAVASPISVVHYETYRNLDDLKNRTQRDKPVVQCIASAQGWFNGSVPFGKTQLPRLTDYADGVDTLEFLSTL